MTVLHTYVQDSAFVCAKSCIHLCKVLHMRMRNLYEKRTFMTVCLND